MRWTMCDVLGVLQIVVLDGVDAAGFVERDLDHLLLADLGLEKAQYSWVSLM